MVREDWVEALALRQLQGVGDRLFRSLVEFFGSPGGALRGNQAQWTRVPGMGSVALSSLREEVDFSWARREARVLLEKGFSVLIFGQTEYPRLLAEIPDPPSVLYVAGGLQREDERAVAVVGSRKASTHGVRFAERMARELALAGVTVVSGLAQGIDAAAHRGALEAGGRTLAVFGAGLDVIYPGWNGSLAQDVRRQGAWLSELPLGSEPLAHHFPRRNRVISGLSLGVVVVEAAERSGTLITAEAALEQGRDVFAVPGLPGSFNARGTHHLIRSGAKLVESAVDVLEDLPGFAAGCSSSRPAGPVVPDLAPSLARALGALEELPQHIDDVASRCGLSAAQVSASLMELCLLGLAEEWPGKRYVRRPNEAKK